MSMFFIFMVLIVGAVAFFHYTQGFFSATLSAIIAIFSAVLAISYHEQIVETFLGGALADYAHAMIVMVLFAAIYTTIRLGFDQLISGGLAMPAVANKTGGAIMGAVAGVFAAGVCAFAAQSMAFGPVIMGYSRVSADESSASIQESPDKPKRMQHPLYDFIEPTDPLNQVDDRTKMFLPVDDILIDTVKLLSEKGALATNKPLSSVHPDWLMEFFGQRLGIEPSGKRVAMNLTGGKQTDIVAAAGKDSHADAGVYLLTSPIPVKLGEQTEVSHIAIKQGDTFPPPLPGKIGIVVRVYFGPKAMDPKNNVIEVSCGSVRIVAQHLGDSGDMEWTDYFPLGTYENGAVYRQRADDYLFVDTENACADFVFFIDAKGFFEESQLPDFKAAATDPKAATALKAWLATAKIADGTFIEVKRLAREDLSGQVVQDMRGLSRGKATFIRKELVKNPPAPPQAVVAASNGPAPNEPDPKQIPVLTAKLMGTWEGTQYGDGDHLMTLTYQKNAFSGTSKVVSGPKAGTVTPLNGTWQAKTATGDGTLTIATKTDTIVIHFNSPDQFEYHDKAGAGDLITFNRKAGTGGATTTNPPPIALQPDASLQLLGLPEENRKFYQAISVPAGSSGEVAVAGGKVTVLDNKIAGLTLNDADPAQLKAAGEPINQFMQADGSVLMQAEAAAGAGGWGWKDRVDQIRGFDASGKEYPLVGVWAVVGGKLVARFNPDGGLSLSDYKPAGPPTQVFLMFKGVESAPITRVMIGQAPLNVKQ